MTYIEVGDLVTADTINLIADRPVCKLIQNTTGNTIASGGSAALAFGVGSEDIDTHAFHDDAVNNTRITPNIAGVYLVKCHLIWAFNSTISYCSTTLFKNGATFATSGNLQFPSTGQNGVSKFGGIVVEEVEMDGSSDYVEMYAGHTSAGAVSQTTNVASPSAASRFSAIWLRPLP